MVQLKNNEQQQIGTNFAVICRANPDIGFWTKNNKSLIAGCYITIVFKLKWSNLKTRKILSTKLN